MDLTLSTCIISSTLRSSPMRLVLLLSPFCRSEMEQREVNGQSWDWYFGKCRMVKPGSLILSFAALPKILLPREIIYTYF